MSFSGVDRSISETFVERKIIFRYILYQLGKYVEDEWKPVGEAMVMIIPIVCENISKKTCDNNDSYII